MSHGVVPQLIGHRTGGTGQAVDPPDQAALGIVGEPGFQGYLPAQRSDLVVRQPDVERRRGVGVDAVAAALQRRGPQDGELLQSHRRGTRPERCAHESEGGSEQFGDVGERGHDRTGITLPVEVLHRDRGIVGAQQVDSGHRDMMAQFARSVRPPFVKLHISVASHAASSNLRFSQ